MRISWMIYAGLSAACFIGAWVAWSDPEADRIFWIFLIVLGVLAGQEAAKRTKKA